MRLLNIEKKALASALASVEGTAYLYGSRADSSAKGGDIDLLVFSKAESPYKLSQKISARFRMECDEKIDVLVVDPDCIPEEQKAFLDIIKQKAVLLQ